MKMPMGRQFRRELIAVDRSGRRRRCGTAPSRNRSPNTLAASARTTRDTARFETINREAKRFGNCTTTSPNAAGSGSGIDSRLQRFVRGGLGFVHGLESKGDTRHQQNRPDQGMVWPGRKMTHAVRHDSPASLEQLGGCMFDRKLY